MIKEIAKAVEVMMKKVDDLHKGFKDLDERFKKYEDNYKPTHKNKIDINKYIKERLGDSYEEKEVEKVKDRVLLMFDAGQWQEIATHELLSRRGMAIVDDSIMSVIKFRKKEQVSLFDKSKDYGDIPQIEIESSSSYPTL